MSRELRQVALRMLNEAHGQRNEAERRLWIARDEVTRHKGDLADAKQREVIAQREYDRAQELLSTIWSDLSPAKLRDETA